MEEITNYFDLVNAISLNNKSINIILSLELCCSAILNIGLILELVLENQGVVFYIY